MNLCKIDFFYFLGIGGIGMSALARYFNSLGKIVYGHDKNVTFLTKSLEKEGITINYHDKIDVLPKWIFSKKCLIIYTSAISKNHNQWNFLKKKSKNIKKRSQVLSIITKNKISIAIGGTHGKTTTCSLLTHILYNSGIKITSFVGGILKNYKSNFISNGLNKEKFFLIEADEFDHSFLYLSPNISCLTSIDQDHTDIYPEKKLIINAYNNFLKKIRKPFKKIFLCKKYNFFSIKNNISYYSTMKKSDYYSDNLLIKKNGKWYFDFHTPKEIWKSLFLPIPGIHNLNNVTAALSIADYLNVNQDKIRKSLYSFKGIERRYSICYQSNKKIYIDDYAHHPTEIDSLIKTVRESFPKKKILGIFQPHLFSRTKFFEDKFAKSLEKLDFLMLLDIYSARECINEYNNVKSDSLLKKVNIKSKNKRLLSLSEVLKIIKKEHKLFDFDIILTIGAGDIDQLSAPITKWLMKHADK